MNKYIWMKVDLNDDERPLVVADTSGQLAIKCGVKSESIIQSISRARKHGWRCCYVKVEEDENE